MRLFVNQYKRKRQDYTAIIDHDDEQDSNGRTICCGRDDLFHPCGCSHGQILLFVVSVALVGWWSTTTFTNDEFSEIRHWVISGSDKNVGNNNKKKSANSPGSIIPTLLQLRQDEDPSQYIHALQNPLYDRLRNATFHYNKYKNTGSGSKQSVEYCSVELTVSPLEVEGGDALTLQWTTNNKYDSTCSSRRSGARLQPSDVLALYCFNEEDEVDFKQSAISEQHLPYREITSIQSTRQLLEVGTLAQIVATQEQQEQDERISTSRRRAAQHRRQTEKGSAPDSRFSRVVEKPRQGRVGTSESTTATTQAPWDAGTWFIPKFNIYRYSQCQFIMYQSKTKMQKNKWQPATTTGNRDEAIELHYLASSPIIQVTSVTSPFGIHLSASADPTEMVVSFSTGNAKRTNGGSSSPGMIAVVKYGRSDPPMEYRATATPSSTTTYQASDMCMEPANVTEPGKFMDPGQLHTVVMTQLAPDTKYYYQVGLQYGQGVTWSKTVYSFQSPLQRPGATDEEVPSFSYLVLADQGCPREGWGQGAAWTAAMVEREVLLPPISATTFYQDDDNITRTSIRAIHHIGDLSYAKGASHHWDAWFDMIEPYAARVPFHIAVGNHEYDYLAGGGGGKDPSVPSTVHSNNDNGNMDDYSGFHPDWGNFGNDSGGECGIPTSKRFTMPQSPRPSSDTHHDDSAMGPVPPSNGVFWYSHDFGNVHTIVLSSEHNMSFGSPQYDWLVADLSRSLNRSVTPWVIVETHRPLYESERFWDQNAVGIGMRYEIEDLLFDYQVDLILSGHYHAYLRTCDGLFRNKCHDTKDGSSYGGPTHITVGTAGAWLDDAALYDTEWTVLCLEHVYGYGRITVANSTALLFEFVKVASEDSSDSGHGDDAGAVLDYVWLKRNRST
ncbi:hypothetical protein ACA910_001127 [Epithemia clementina (nom. ined.)]